MERILTNDTPSHVGETITVIGWVHARRDHGKLIFIDLRDRSGLLQVVLTGEAAAAGVELRSEWVIAVSGVVQERPESMINPDMPSGTVELKAETLTILSQAETPPFDLTTDGYEIGEEHRLTHRYLDLRRPRLQRNLRVRHQIAACVRAFLTQHDFVEIETPLLTKSTPEGARDYVVPSRVHPGAFYALPQSPQQYKQLLMVAGMERYFQLARALRDEDTRGDRQPEHTQIDIELSFTSRDEILELIESLIREIVSTLFPNHRIAEDPFPRISYTKAMEAHNSDRPDLRRDPNDPHELAFAFVVDFPMFEKRQDGSLGAVHHPFTRVDAPTDEMRSSDPLRLVAEQYDLVLNGEEVGGGSIREHDPARLQSVFEIMGHESADIKAQFGHLLEAFGYGVPPHGGMALGLDRLVMVLLGEPNIREVIAFPKTGDARDLMMRAPSPISQAQLAELGIRIEKKE